MVEVMFVTSETYLWPATATVGSAGFFWNRSVNGYEPFDASRNQEIRICLQQFLVVTVRDSQKEKITLAQKLFDAADDDRAVRVANFLQNHANRKKFFCTRKLLASMLGRYFSSARRGQNSLPCRLRNGTRRRGIVQHGRNGSRRSGRRVSQLLSA